MEIKVGTGDLEIVTYNVGIMSVDKEEEEVWEDGDCEIWVEDDKYKVEKSKEE